MEASAFTSFTARDIQSTYLHRNRLNDFWKNGNLLLWTALQIFKIECKVPSQYLMI